MKLQLLRKKPETPDVISFIFKPAEPVTWKAGQFFHYVLHHEPTDNRGSDRWFTIASAPFEEYVMITTRINTQSGSSFKKKLADLKEGKSIEISYLEGDFTVNDLAKEYVFIAGGIGITPFHSILKELNHENKQIKAVLLYANRDQHVVYKDELEAMVKNNPTLHIHYIFPPEHIDEKKIRELIPDLQKPFFYISGPEPMVDNLGELLKGLGIAKDHIKQDWFPGYPAE